MSLVGMGLSLYYPHGDSWLCADDAKLICPAGSAVWKEKTQGETSHHPEPNARTAETSNSPETHQFIGNLSRISWNPKLL